MNNKISFIKNAPLSGWLFALVITGYPFIALIGSFLNLETIIVSLPFRIGIILLSAILWVNSPSIFSLFFKSPWLTLLFIIYFFRLLWDSYIVKLPGAPDALLFYLITVLIPSILFSLNTPTLNQKYTAKIILFLGGGICTLIMFMQIFNIELSRQYEDSDQLFFEGLNPISIGHSAVTTIIVSLYLFRQQITKIKLLIIYFFSFTAIFVLLLSGSRGPTVSLIACILAFMIHTRRWLLIIIFSFAIIFQLIGDDILIASRFNQVGIDESTLGRIFIQENAIQQFLANPFFGSAYFESETKDYPHNIFIEIAMALGTLGLSLLFIVLWKALKNCRTFLLRDQIFIPLLFLQYFIGVQFSGAFWGNSAFWIITAFLCRQSNKFGEGEVLSHQKIFH